MKSDAELIIELRERHAAVGVPFDEARAPALLAVEQERNAAAGELSEPGEIHDFWELLQSNERTDLPTESESVPEPE